MQIAGLHSRKFGGLAGIAGYFFSFRRIRWIWRNGFVGAVGAGSEAASVVFMLVNLAEVLFG